VWLGWWIVGLWLGDWGKGRREKGEGRREKGEGLEGGELGNDGSGGMVLRGVWGPLVLIGWRGIWSGKSDTERG
jgi:hypothetical protein